MKYTACLLIIFFSQKINAQVTYDPGSGGFYGNTSGTYHASSVGALYAEQMAWDNQLYQQQMSQFDQQSRATQDMYNRHIEESQQSQMVAFAMYAQNMKIREAGERRIKAGKASNLFVANPNFSLANELLKHVKTEEERQQVISQTKQYLELFIKKVKKTGCQVNNVPEGASLAFIICYEIYSGAKPSEKHFQNIKAAASKDFLKNSYIQGMADKEKQVRYEKFGAITMYALDLYRKNASASQKEAKDIAAGIMQFLFSRPAEQIIMTADAFEWKGTWLIKNGKATDIYNYVPLTQQEISKTVSSIGSATLTNEQAQLIITEVEKEVVKKGGQVNNLSYALAVVIHACYYVYSDGKEFTDKQFRGVLAWAKKQTLTTPELQALNDMEKRNLYIQNILKVGHTYLQYVQNKQNGWADVVKSNRETAYKYLKAYFAPENFDKLQLTENGFHSK